MYGSRIFRVGSILMIVGGGLSTAVSIFVVVGLITLSGIFTAVEILTSEPAIMTLGSMLIITMIVTVARSLLQLIAGIMGVCFWNNPCKISCCFKLGCVTAGISLVSFFLSLGTGAFSSWTLVSLVVPGLYLYGAYRIKS